ncbi:hypothetical protein U3516DRAFT_747186 [Neocallimastix sp. 'constans']
MLRFHHLKKKFINLQYLYWHFIEGYLSLTIQFLQYNYLDDNLKKINKDHPYILDGSSQLISDKLYSGCIRIQQSAPMPYHFGVDALSHGLQNYKIWR